MTKGPPPNVQPLHPPGDWFALRARAAEQLIRVTDPARAAGELFDLIAPDLRLNVLLFYNVKQNGGLKLATHRGISQEQAAAMAASLGRIAVNASFTGHIPNVQASEDPQTEILKGLGLSAYAGMRLVGNGHLMGILGFGRCWTDRFEEDELGFLGAVSGYFAAALERLRNEAARSEGEEQMRLAMETAGFGTFEQDLINRERIWSPELKAIYGLPPDVEVTLGRLIELAHPDDRERVLQKTAESRATFAAGHAASYADEHRIVRPDGEVRWISVRGQTLVREEDGERRPARLIGIVQDITDRKRAEERICASEERLQLAQELGGVASWDWSLESDQYWVSDSYRRIFGLPPSSPVSRQLFEELVHPDDLEHVKLARANLDVSDFNVEFRITRPSDHEMRWIHSLGGAVRDASGTTRLVGISLDITDRKRDQERERLLSREVDHRAKNLLNIVQSMVQLTRADTMPAFVEEVIGRIHALARVHSLIAASRWEGASLSRLVEEELKPFIADGERFHIEGPLVELKPGAAQSMALIVHELTINAVKYGALSRPAGRIDIAWSLTGHSAGELLLSWQELGGPATRAPRKAGFGTNLIHGSIERHLGGTVRMDWRAEGLRCEIALPARQLV